jgi:hypothetical protein
LELALLYSAMVHNPFATGSVAAVPRCLALELESCGVPDEVRTYDRLGGDTVAARLCAHIFGRYAGLASRRRTACWRRSYRSGGCSGLWCTFY